MEKGKIVLTLSGGLDSVTLLYFLRAEGYTPLALSVDYGQRHSKEIIAARSICEQLSVKHNRLDLMCLSPLLTGSSQTDPTIEVPEGHYTEDSMKLTVVPNRNMILLAVAGAWAISEKAIGVAYAAHAGDHAVYPDCRPEFIRAMDTALGLADWHTIKLWAPFADRTKAQIVALGAALGVPFERTWSCYQGSETACGRCGTCFERREAFLLAGVPDPTTYLDTTPVQELIRKFNSRAHQPGAREFSADKWECGKCKSTNPITSTGCDFCGARKGYGQEVRYVQES